MASWRDRPFLLAAGVLLLAGLAYAVWVSSPAEPAGANGGQLQIAHVENTHTQRADVVIHTLTEEGAPVDGHASTLRPGAVEHYGSLSCRDGDFHATHLRIMLRLGSADGYDAERFVELEAGDCREGGGAVFDVVVTGEGRLAVERSR